MAKVFGIVSTKGCVGKTSIAANIGGILADMGQHVLLIDGDFQQSLSDWFEITDKAEFGLRQFITKAQPTNCISSTAIDNLDIVLSDDPNGKLIDWFRASTNNVYYLLASIKRLTDCYDYVIIDSQGARGILQESIILASDSLICPLVPNVMESREFIRGTIQMLKSLEPPAGVSVPVPNIPPLYCVIYKQDRTNNSIKIANAIRKQFYQGSGGKISVLDTFVPNLTAYKKAVAVPGCLCIVLRSHDQGQRPVHTTLFCRWCMSFSRTLVTPIPSGIKTMSPLSRKQLEEKNNGK